MGDAQEICNSLQYAAVELDALNAFVRAYKALDAALMRQADAGLNGSTSAQLEAAASVKSCRVTLRDSLGFLDQIEVDAKKLSSIQVIVGNIGVVYDGNFMVEAIKLYDEYVSQSQSNRGRAAGEPVTILKDGDVHKEYAGTLHEN